MTKSISVKEIIMIMIKNIWIIVLCGLIAGGALGALAKVKQSTTFIAERELTISHNTVTTNVTNPNNQLNADLNMIPTYADLAEDNVVLKTAHANLPKSVKQEYTAKQLKRTFDVITKPDSLVISLKARTGNAKDSVEIVNAVAKSIKQELPSLKADAGQVKLLSLATTSEVVSDTHPSIKKYAVLGFAIGVLLGIVIAFTRVTWKKFI